MPSGGAESRSAMEEAEATLRKAGLAMPPIPEGLRPALRRQGKWQFATRALPLSPYFLRYYLDELRAGEVPDYVVLAHAGHGANSYAIHYFQVGRHLRLFLKVGWGGVHLNPDEDAIRVNGCFRLAAELTAAVETARRTGRLAATDRMTVVAADYEPGLGFRVSGSDDGGSRRHVASRTGFRRPREVLQAALDWLNARPRSGEGPRAGRPEACFGLRPSGSRRPATGVVSLIGGREAMEDRYVLEWKGGGLLGGVLDGHGGKRAADRVAEGLPGLFFAALGAGRDPAAAFREAYAALDRATRRLVCGTAATCFFLRRETLTVAHVGDGRCLLVGGGGASVLTEDHRVEQPAERARIERAGGEIRGHYVRRGDRGLMLTRSFGDRMMRPAGVMAIPDLTSQTLSLEDRRLVTACDGLWDVLSVREVAALVSGAATPQAAADALAAAVAERCGGDNLTILVVECV